MYRVGASVSALSRAEPIAEAARRNDDRDADLDAKAAMSPASPSRLGAGERGLVDRPAGGVEPEDACLAVCLPGDEVLDPWLRARRAQRDPDAVGDLLAGAV